MCIAIPTRIEAVSAEGSARLADGRRVSLALLSGASVGDFVIVQSGFATQRLAQAEAARVLALLAEAGLTDGGAG